MELIIEEHFNREVYVFKERPKNIYEMLLQTISKYPEQEAVVCNGERLTYRMFGEKVNALAANLQKTCHVKKGDRVALLLGNNIEFTLLVFACAKIGAIIVTLNTRLLEKDLAYMINHSDAKILFVDTEFAGQVDEMKASSSLPNVISYSIVGGSRESYINFEDLLNDQHSIEEVEVNEDDPLFIMYTSGTTGLPKGAVGSHLGCIHSVINFEFRLETSEQTRTLIAVPLFHVTGLIAQFLHMVRVGGTSVIIKRYKTDVYTEVLFKEKVTLLFNVPTIFTMLLKHPTFRENSNSTVNCIAYGGAPMATAIIERLREIFPNASFHNSYGATELSSSIATMPKDYPDEKLDAVGLPILGAELKVVKEDGSPCEPGEPGELLVKGAMTIEGYWKNEEANEKSFIDDYWCSGDIGTVDREGFVYILDRKKDMINRGGEKIYSIEVEKALYENPKIHEVAVVGIPDSVFGEVVKAFVAPKVKGTLSSEEVISFAQERLPSYKVPSKVEIIDELPKNPNGKILKKQLRN